MQCYYVTQQQIGYRKLYLPTNTACENYVTTKILPKSNLICNLIDTSYHGFYYVPNSVEKKKRRHSSGKKEKKKTEEY